MVLVDGSLKIVQLLSRWQDHQIKFPLAAEEVNFRLVQHATSPTSVIFNE